MKMSKKSNVTNYKQLYQLAILAFTIVFLYISFTFLLPIANFISLFTLTFGSLYFLIFLFSHETKHLIFALVGGILTIFFSLIFYFLV